MQTNPPRMASPIKRTTADMPCYHRTEFKTKKVVLVSIPGAFTPTCSGSHIPSYTEHIDKLKAKGVDLVIVVAFNDAFVMSGWAKANGVTDDSIVSALPTLSTRPPYKTGPCYELD